MLESHKNAQVLTESMHTEFILVAIFRNVCWNIMYYAYTSCNFRISAKSAAAVKRDASADSCQSFKKYILNLVDYIDVFNLFINFYKLKIFFIMEQKFANIDRKDCENS